jgi:hypothetical protein
MDAGTRRSKGAGAARWLLAGVVLAASCSLAPPAMAAGDGTFTPSPDSPISAGGTPSGIAVADFNQDGDSDLAVINRDSGDLSLFTGTTDAGFTPPLSNVPLSGSPTGIVTGDFNQDGDPDLAVATGGAAASNNNVTILTAGTGSTFTVGTPIGVNQVPSSIAVGDFNRDGDPDLAVPKSNGRMSVLVGGAGSSFTPDGGATSVGDSPSAITAADFNADGDVDLAVTSSLLTKVTVLIGGSGATFAPEPTTLPTGTSPRAIAAANFDGDAAGDPDLAVANSGSDSISLFTGLSGPAFAPADSLAVGDEPSGIAVADLNGDGDPDLAVSNEASTNTAGFVSVFLGGGGAAFTQAPGSPITTGARPLAVASADFNGDGSADLVVADGGPDVLEVFLGKAPVVSPPPGGGDTKAPQTTIDSGPSGETDKSKAKIRYSADELATFECKLKGKRVDRALGQFTACGAAKVKYKHLQPGKKKFQVRAIDAAGNADPTPAKLKWKVLAG